MLYNVIQFYTNLAFSTEISARVDIQATVLFASSLENLFPSRMVVRRGVDAIDSAGLRNVPDRVALS